MISRGVETLKIETLKYTCTLRKRLLTGKLDAISKMEALTDMEVTTQLLAPQGI